MEYFKRLKKRYGEQWDYAIAMINSGDKELLEFYFTELRKNKNKKILELCRKILKERNITIGNSKSFEELETSICEQKNYPRIELPSTVKHETYRKNGNGLCENCEMIELKHRIKELLIIGFRKAKETTPTIWKYSKWLMEFSENKGFINSFQIKELRKENAKGFGGNMAVNFTVDKLINLLQNQRPAINIARRYDEHLRKTN